VFGSVSTSPAVMTRARIRNDVPRWRGEGVEFAACHQPKLRVVIPITSCTVLEKVDTSSELMKNKVIRYSEAFKLQVVREGEEGVLTCDQARIKYGLGHGRVPIWIKRLGKLHVLPKVIRVGLPTGFRFLLRSWTFQTQ
jgi:hypothetical protein